MDFRVKRTMKSVAGDVLPHVRMFAEGFRVALLPVSLLLLEKKVVKIFTCRVTIFPLSFHNYHLLLMYFMNNHYDYTTQKSAFSGRFSHIFSGAPVRSRTEVNGFAGHCLTVRPQAPGSGGRIRTYAFRTMTPARITTPLPHIILSSEPRTMFSKPYVYGRRLGGLPQLFYHS